jgi:TetR/AcrR family transcriptional regulator, transcriptional repressor for nem operon
MKKQTNPERSERTRSKIIYEAASLFHHKGYTATGLDELLKNAGVTKGAFYHHFKSKKDVALAVINEVVAEKVRKRMIEPVANSTKPIAAIRKVLSTLRTETPPPDLLTGCPINNLASELALQDKELQRALSKLMIEWEIAWTEALKREPKRHQVKNPHEFCLYLIALIEGAQSLAKTQQSRKPLDATLKRLENLLGSS